MTSIQKNPYGSFYSSEVQNKPGSKPAYEPRIISTLFQTAAEAELFAGLAPDFDISAEVVTDPDKAFAMHAAQADRENTSGRTNSGMPCNPDDFGDSARKYVEAGGALVQMSLMPGSESTDALYAAFYEARRAQNSQIPIA